MKTESSGSSNNRRYKAILRAAVAATTEDIKLYLETSGSSNNRRYKAILRAAVAATTEDIKLYLEPSPAQ